jgi:hypothetical protein
VDADKILLMRRHVLLRLWLSVLAGIPAGFVALAFAAAHEPSIPGPLLSLLSPGLKAAELLATPTVHEPLGSVFGQFLRVAFAVNAAYYVTIFAVAAQWLKRPRSRRDYPV